MSKNMANRKNCTAEMNRKPPARALMSGMLAVAGSIRNDVPKTISRGTKQTKKASSVAPAAA